VIELTKKITIELADYEIDWLARIGDVWAVNDGDSSGSDESTQTQGQYDVETVAATLAANEAMRLVQGYNSSKARHIGREVII
jgi:hypothetical protein